MKQPKTYTPRVHTVTALQYVDTDASRTAIALFAGEVRRDGVAVRIYPRGGIAMWLYAGDWIIKIDDGTQDGYFVHMIDAEFTATYEAVKA